MENYFILIVNIVNYINNTEYLMITKHSPVKRINWKITSKIPTFKSIILNLLFLSPIIFFMLILSQILNILTSVLAGKSTVRTLKNMTDFLILIQFLILFIYVFKKSVKVYSQNSLFNSNLLFNHYRTALGCSDKKIPYIMDFYFGVRSSYQFINE